MESETQTKKVFDIKEVIKSLNSKEHLPKLQSNDLKSVFPYIELYNTQRRVRVKGNSRVYSNQFYSKLFGINNKVKELECSHVQANTTAKYQNSCEFLVSPLKNNLSNRSRYIVYKKSSSISSSYDLGRNGIRKFNSVNDYDDLVVQGMKTLRRNKRKVFNNNLRLPDLAEVLTSNKPHKIL